MEYVLTIVTSVLFILIVLAAILFALIQYKRNQSKLYTRRKEFQNIEMLKRTQLPVNIPKVKYVLREKNP